MSEVIVHACSTLCNPDLLTDQQVREELKRATTELFNKDLQIIELKQYARQLDNILVKLAQLQIAGNLSDVHSELQRLAAHYQQQKAAQSARQVH
ncbi:hypothetical protein [Pseudomonas sp. WS 5079]|uniref:hypothetical protein n=1 Tax=Pseudomonas sp. WS 5079 TaxID=2717492 RepID=UPI001551901D|nr:hypothetical protein [Pseudomonas sp. WS 5079]NMX60226.1 hypothetical protein [Pseudomonas sp. WS 5079]